MYVELKNINKNFGDYKASDNVNFGVEKGKLIGLLGPSGSGMGDNPRYILYESEYEAVVANNANAERTEKVTVAGKCCESGDILLKDAMMPEIKVGDTLAVLATGAYNYSMASNYNRIPRAAVVAVSDGKAKVVVKRESYEDLIKNDVL